MRLKGGDPMLFSRAQEELDALSAARTPVAIAENVSLEGSNVVAGILQDLEMLAAQRGNGPAVVLICEVWAKIGVRAQFQKREQIGP